MTDISPKRTRPGRRGGRRHTRTQPTEETVTITYCPDCGEPAYCSECFACDTCETDCNCGAHDDNSDLAYEGYDGSY